MLELLHLVLFFFISWYSSKPFVCGILTSRSIRDTKTKADRYIISLLDRTNMLEKMGFDRLNEDHREVYLTFYWELEQEIQSFFLPRILQNLSKQQLKTHFIKDENRIFPNEQEITVYLQQQLMKIYFKSNIVSTLSS
jgi:hypothetical protein